MPRRKINVKKRIEEALEENTSLTWSELKQKTTVSKASLSKHLTLLIKIGFVLTKTRDSRPPVTEYYLADNKKLKIISYLTKNMSEEQVTFFVNNLLTEEVFSILSDSFEEILKNYSKSTHFNHLFFSIDSLIKSIGLPESSKLAGSLDIPFHPADLANLRDIVEEEEVGVKEVFSEIAVQLVLMIYELENGLLISLAKAIKELENPRAKLEYNGDFKGFLILPLIQKHYVWREFEALSSWWKENVTQKIPSALIIALTALNIFKTNPAVRTYLVNKEGEIL